MKTSKFSVTKNEMLSKRFIAYLLDSFLLSLLLLLILIFLVSVMNVFALLIIGHLLYFVIAFLYFVFMEYKFGYTLGKKMLGLVVLSEKGKKISFVSSIIRNFLKYLPLGYFLITIDAIGILTTKKQQRFTEIIAKTIVIEKILPIKEKFASFGRRAAAKLIDWIIYLIFFFLSAFFSIFEKNESLMIKLTLIYYLIWFLSISFYEIYKIKSSGQTEGKKLMRIRVVRCDNKEMSWKTSIVRWVTKFFSYMILGLGIFRIIFDKNKQAWHDKMAGTYVINVKEYEEFMKKK